jgi:hypothetical protein
MQEGKKQIAGAAALIALVAGSSGCAVGVSVSSGEHYPQIAVGSHIELLQRLEVAPGWARSFVQFGKPVAPEWRDRFSLWCDFEVTDLRARDAPAAWIEPGQFRVTEVNWWQDNPLQIFSFGAFQKSGGGPSNVEYSTRLQLHSDSQPQLRALNCTHRVDHLFYPRQPTRAEIRAALDGVARIESVDPAAQPADQAQPE